MCVLYILGGVTEYKCQLVTGITAERLHEVASWEKLLDGVLHIFQLVCELYYLHGVGIFPRR